jgi:hypothetical protein
MVSRGRTLAIIARMTYRSQSRQQALEAAARTEGRMTRSKSLAVAALLILVPFTAAADEMTYTYSLATAACKIIALPAANIPVRVMGSQTGVNDSGMADLTMEWNTVEHVLQWMGIDYASSAIIRGKSAVTDTHIAYMDGYYAGVVLNVQNASHLKVCNNLNGVVEHGTVTLIW